VSLYCYNGGTAANYFEFKGCGFNTSSTGYYAALGATATVAASAVGIFTNYNVTGLTGYYNYLTVEYYAAATGTNGSSIIQLTVW